jgi:NADH:ubiquinone oxidoreductase subunit 5 (subunit L)/multisubunit Na+/H+ antiporter MnhA subunit
VGACSYFLISFWHTDPANASAGKKAFVTNRIGDWGFMVGDVPHVPAVGSINYSTSASARTPVPSHHHRHGDRGALPSSPRAASRPSFRCSSGCPTPWPAPRRCRR